MTFAVVATLVANSKAPPAKVVLHPLHFQIPHDTLLTLVYDLKKKYFSAGWTDVLGVLLEFEFFDYFSDSRAVSGSVFSGDACFSRSFGHCY